MERAAELLQSQEDFGRSGVRHALHACYSFLQVRGLSGQGLKLIAALESVDRGVLPEVFDPEQRPGQAPKRKWSRSAASRETKLGAGSLGPGTAALIPSQAGGRSVWPNRRPRLPCGGRLG